MDFDPSKYITGINSKLNLICLIRLDGAIGNGKLYQLSRNPSAACSNYPHRNRDRGKIDREYGIRVESGTAVKEVASTESELNFRIGLEKQLGLTAMPPNITKKHEVPVRHTAVTHPIPAAADAMTSIVDRGRTWTCIQRGMDVGKQGAYLNKVCLALPKGTRACEPRVLELLSVPVISSRDGSIFPPILHITKPQYRDLLVFMRSSESKRMLGETANIKGFEVCRLTLMIAAIRLARSFDSVSMSRRQDAGGRTVRATPTASARGQAPGTSTRYAIKLYFSWLTVRGFCCNAIHAILIHTICKVNLADRSSRLSRGRAEVSVDRGLSGRPYSSLVV
ncbi:hypothetical protein EVAR_99768_1 [Eumeta japonica]|uniref:Uncharacterized protein n=1 Tax=Eumeta variegata TaxID=151549 RepID=A0A4C1SBJ1_EUMVA|nr:hypothetical protein EVAR_99768_1 [Eumeta japonica]